MAIISKIQLKNKEGLIIDENIMLDYNIIAVCYFKNTFRNKFKGFNGEVRLNNATEDQKAQSIIESSILLISQINQKQTKQTKQNLVCLLKQAKSPCLFFDCFDCLILTFIKRYSSPCSTLSIQSSNLEIAPRFMRSNTSA